jgi:N-acetylneuraminic acid mutarotase
MFKQILRSLLLLFILAVVAISSAPVSAGSPPPPLTGVTSIPTAGAVPAVGVDDQLQNFDCAQIAALGIDRQLNLRAGNILINCGFEVAGSGIVTTSASRVEDSIADYGSTDVQVNSALADTYPNVTQSTTSFAAHGQTIVAVYNSSTTAPANYSGISYSEDGGVTFNEIRPSPFSSGHGTNYGSPMVIYNYHAGQFFAFWLVSGGDCGTQGLGSWYSYDGFTWYTGPCVHVSSNDDREGAWSDNDPSSPYYGRMYVSWSDFNLGGALLLAYSDDEGYTWSAPITLSATFLRTVQGVSGQDGTAFLATLDEGGGGANPRQNWIFTSTDGGVTWNGSAMGSSFTAPGDIDCNTYFRGISPIWRYMGAGSLGAGPDGVLHYAYTIGGSGDAGNIYYVRSTDSGVTWSSPLKLNSDAGTHTQWMPSLSVTSNGRVFVSWYDRRNTSTDDYQRFARVSLDNGASWETDQPLSDQIIPQPAQPDPSVTACYAGDYDFSAASGTTAIGGWTDGRVIINGTNQQDVYADRIDFAAPEVCTPAESAWQLVAGLPESVFGPAVASDGEFIYSAGGSDMYAGELNQFARYDPSTNAWSVLSPLPSAVANAMAAYVDGKIYVFGGLLASGDVVNLTQVYDIASDTWDYGLPMPDVRSFMGGGAYNGKIYVIGGYTTGLVTSAQDQTWVYNPALNNWTTGLTPIPHALGGASSGVIGGHIYLAGGRDAADLTLNTLFDYNVAANTWTPRASLPVAVNVAGGTAFNGKLWVMGGGTPFLDSATIPDGSISPETMSTVQIYNPPSDSWSTGPNQNSPRSFQSAGVAGGTIVSVGGYSNTVVAITESFLRQRLNILLVYADSPAPATLQTQLISMPGVATVDLYEAMYGTPTADLLQNYDVVVAWSNYAYANPADLGNELADYVDNGGVVVELAFNFYDSTGNHPTGRWQSGDYPAFSLSSSIFYAYASLGVIYIPGSPLNFGVGDISAYYRMDTTATAGATTIAEWDDASQLLAVKGRSVGVTGFFGDTTPGWSGDLARIIVNAGFSLRIPSGVCNTTTIFLPLLFRNY